MAVFGIHASHEQIHPRALLDAVRLRECVDVIRRRAHGAPAGQAVTDDARADGYWSALDDVENLVQPDALRAALDDDPGGAATVGRLPALGEAGDPGVGS